MFLVDAKLFFRHNTEPGLFTNRGQRSGEVESGKGTQCVAFMNSPRKIIH
jgi:hypothetical protein